MTFSGTLIEDLMAAVERVEQKVQSDGALVVESMLADAAGVEPWFAAVQENPIYESNVLGVA
jgi:hypothetical protein